MAAAELGLEGLEGEFLCWLCLGYFEEPVIIHCGHNFCRGCITRCWEQFRDTFPCPQCGAESPEIRLRPNRQLRNAADLFTEERGFWLRGRRARDRLCEKHGERLNLFCEEDRTPICVICRVSQAHRSHPAVPLEEESQGFKVGNSRRVRVTSRKSGMEKIPLPHRLPKPHNCHLVSPHSSGDHISQ
ncbi:hypothetical protein KIL84_004124 [Mauremys mutica]|uniref:Uncharacterized protein n=1 Tax=Mauremys mutica TaxID=74926 RepID=A0A9D3XME0_9SAUR|nr:hypothetical protein KIL84_004124 [Mauremys mutica]